MTSGAGPAVLDASAVLAWLRDEPGADVVDAHLSDGVLGAINLSEVHQKLTQHGIDADRTIGQLRTLGVRVEPFGLADAIATSTLWPATRDRGLSLADRACLALARRLGCTAITADTAWTQLDLDVTVVAIR
ncbi:PIN domain nuclease, a component of toxin-antitoxin system (PIN domain) [Pseudonocardia ammonioxydans]|uniref:PIN domain nuclease, a component of toxin-antitoxin system (PIN domain) n=1 Tax=Pseudonocardia ammonioxydans TaxID=260086 RepID=A0A1I5GJ71_PSUAM|nr:type II toxin-antitoxin system VapC family toxin [Pseudonocardia ammonioxydans]SFO36038.1 PIN domain nuclease, a component of toxin-antitoxin system (PIN domain) [Pseudonocardia ammonioxydans]